MVREGLKCFKIDRYQPVATETDLEDAAFARKSNRTFYAGIVFMDQDDLKAKKAMETLEEHVRYKIRMGRDSVPKTHVLKDK